jgi:hypothetical protein
VIPHPIRNGIRIAPTAIPPGDFEGAHIQGHFGVKRQCEVPFPNLGQIASK